MTAPAQAGSPADDPPAAALARVFDADITIFIDLLNKFREKVGDFEGPEIHFDQDQGILENLRQDMSTLHDRHTNISRNSAYHVVKGPTLGPAWQEIGRVIDTFWDILYAKETTRDNYRRSIIMRNLQDLIGALTEGRDKCNDILKRGDEALGRLTGS